MHVQLSTSIFKMRYLVSLILALSLLTSMGSDGFSEKPLRLFFEKKIASEEPAVLPPTNGTTYTVRDGEWLYKILSQRGYSHEEIQASISIIQQLNPDIPDLAHLRPGQILHLPENLTPPKTSPPETEPKKNRTPETASYIVKPGDTVAEILENEAAIPRNQIYKGYLNKFLELNPKLKDAHSLQAGQEVILPRLEATEKQIPQGSQVSKQISQGTQQANSQDLPLTILPSGQEITIPLTHFADTPSTTATEETPPPPSAANATNATNATTAPAKTIISGLPLLRTLLGQMNFSFVPGDEAIYPVDENRWLRIKMTETPLIEAPWGAKFLLNPVPQDELWYKQVKALGIQVCNITPTFLAQDVFKAIAEKAPNNFRVWESTRELTFNRNGLTYSLHAPQMVIITKGDNKHIFVIWNRKTVDEAPLPQCLPEILEKAQIKLIEFDAFNELSRLPRMPKQSVFMPPASVMEIVRAMNPKDPEALFGKSLPTTLDDLLFLLKTKGLLQQGAASMVWARGVDHKISIQVPAWTVAGQSRIVLLQPSLADEFLVFLLTHQGYSCFLLPE